MGGGIKIDAVLPQGHPVSQQVRCCSLHWTNKAGALEDTLMLDQGTIPTTVHLKWYP